MITYLLYVYLAGWVGTTGYQSYQCISNPPQRVITKAECHAIGVIGGALWPVIAYNEVTK